MTVYVYGGERKKKDSSGLGDLGFGDWMMAVLLLVTEKTD